MSDREQPVTFKYDAAADLFSPRIGATRGPLVYKRFASAKAAVQFAIERLSPASLSGTYLEVEDERYGAVDIRRLYEQHARQGLIGDVNVPD